MILNCCGFPHTDLFLFISSVSSSVPFFIQHHILRVCIAHHFTVHTVLLTKVFFLNDPILFHMSNHELSAGNTSLSFSPSISPELLTHFQLLLYICSYCYKENSIPMSQNRTYHLPPVSPPFLYACLHFWYPITSNLSPLSPHPVIHQVLLSYLLSTFKSIFYSPFPLPLF